jgi:hypothetical protein
MSWQVDGNRRKESEPTQRCCAESGSLQGSWLTLLSSEPKKILSPVKNFKPDIAPEELRTWIMRFRDAVREKRGL